MAPTPYDTNNAELVKRDPFEGGMPRPDRLADRFFLYGRRYGYVRAICNFIGRRWFSFWKLTGPLFAPAYIRRWLAKDIPHILNLGGGGVIFDRWLTVDVDPRSDVYVDITQRLPFPDASIDVVYAEEVIEHVPRETGLAMLREVTRVLKPGGWIRLTTPSLNYFANRALADLEGSRAINDIFYRHEHRHIYSEADLQALLREAGFVEMMPSSYRDPNSRYGYFDTHPARFAFALAEWSQYWEAQRP